MKKCKKCNQPVYVYEPGFGSQKPYVSALCIDHIYENFAALGILPASEHAGWPPMVPEAGANQGGASEKPACLRTHRQKGEHNAKPG